MNRKSFLLGLVLGSIIGAIFAALAVKHFTANHYELTVLAHGNFPALKMNKKTGDVWVLTPLGKWLLVVDDEENAQRKIQPQN